MILELNALGFWLLFPHPMNHVPNVVANSWLLIIEGLYIFTLCLGWF
jgi:hypothetical protein